MAWILDIGSSEPRSYKLGELEGESLKAQNLDDQKRRELLADINDVYLSGKRELRPDERPNLLRLTNLRSDKIKINMFQSSLGCLVVANAVKSVIEMHDYEKHQFVEIELYKSKSKLESNPWYILNVWRRFESIDENQSQCIKETVGYDKKRRLKFRWYKKNAILKLDKPDGLNIWRDERFSNILIFSKELGDDLISKKLLDLPKFETFKASR